MNYSVVFICAGVILTIREASERDQKFTLPCQWTNFRNQPIPLDKPEKLLSADDRAAFPHIALHLLKPGDDVPDLLIRFQSGNARGVVLAHTSDDVPDIEGLQLNAGDVRIPVVLIARKLGEGLLSEMREFSNTLHVSILQESSAHSTLSEYQPPDVWKAAGYAASCVGTAQETPGHTGKHFYFRKRMHKLLFDSSSKPVVMCTDFEKFSKTFQLLDEHEQYYSKQKKVSKVKLKKQFEEICSQLTKCMEKNYLQDFPFHCIMVW